ncbi:single-stranded-DNA-specific exonuclease RecJ [Bombilactobacillus folatiphilus]|uniref:Single-stranded-DNA-specific exonuclease RecJ n=1 Tax=Bombilactobacillus folatiphilus TaxID=2923362 RepID=A0ABY4P7F6_9LACO|nr:single-stranded-DNA-specific exonuclease RecJ [Bombilactobacillus folatiphilus]UQS81572.1 single-stranded-DNA-specific exonuclease RecJ [Bombilactobacillus folatiphilus]
MSLQYQWQSTVTTPSDQTAQIAQQTGLPLVLVQLLEQRGLKTFNQVEDFLRPDVQQLCDPYLLHDMQLAVDRITQAIVEGQKILIYGDYDADGITSTTILKEAIENLGGQVEYFIPDRFDDGYGPNLTRYQDFVTQGFNLIVTVDNGVTGLEEVTYAQNHGVDVIITDHHTLPAQLPPAVAIVHPAFVQDDLYPCPYLSGAGVAFKLASALLEEVPYDLIDLAAIGTIADVMELVGENRVLVALGLQQIRTQERIGLAKLMKVAHLSVSDLTEEDIAFQLAPRLNALGRLANANQGVKLLSTFDEEQATSLAKEIDHLNQQRKQMSQEVFEEAWLQAQEQLAAGSRILVLAGKTWHQGILGIVAGKVLQQSGCPTLVFQVNEQKQAIGSGRSNAQFDLYQALVSQKALYQKFGGHAHACGLTMQAAALSKLQQQLNLLPAAKQLDIHQKPCRDYSLELEVADLSLDFYQQLRRLAPFGQGNPNPLIKIADFDQARIGFLGKKSQTHLKIWLNTPNQTLECLGFNWGQQYENLRQNHLKAVYGTLTTNNWHKQVTVQLTLEDVQLAAELDHQNIGQSQFIDLRQEPYLGSRHVKYPLLFFDARNQQRFILEHDDYQTCLISADCASFQTAVLMDCPSALADFEQAIRFLSSVKQLFFVFHHTQQPVTIASENWHAALKYFFTHQQLPVQDLPLVARYLRISNLQIKLIIRVFSELKFVTIKSGLLYHAKMLPKRQLSESTLYCQNQAQLKIKQTLIDSEFSQLIGYVQKLQNRYNVRG